MNKPWPTLASIAYIGCTWSQIAACGDFDDRGLFATPSETKPDGSSGASGIGTGGTGGIGGIGGMPVGSAGATTSASSGVGGSVADGGAGAGGGGGGASGAGGNTTGGAGGNVVDAGISNDAAVGKVCTDLHTMARTALDSADACSMAGSFTECRLVQDECGCSVGVKVSSTQSTQRYLMAVQSLKASQCLDACSPDGCPPFSGTKCTPAAQGRFQCVAF